jgi:phosphatidyl-myo-inositol dimannoside synthase
MTPRVLVVTPDYPPAYGGIQLLMHRLVSHWQRCAADVVTIGESTSAPARRIRQPPFGGRRAAVAALNIAAVGHGVRSRPDVVLSGHAVVAPAALALKRIAGVPYVQYAYAMELGRRRLASAALTRADAVVAISEHTVDRARALGADPARTHLIPPGVDLPAGRAVEPFERPTVITVSRLDERYKGHDVLLRAMPLVRARVPDARLLIVGDGKLRPTYEQLAHSFSLNGAVEFRGSVSDGERDDALARSDVFAMPSRLSPTQGGEGFGIVYLEANAHGLPVVAGNVAGALDAVVDGETGVLVDPTDHVAVADAVADLLLDRERARTLGRAGAERAREFAWPLIAERVEDVLLEVANGRT